MAFFQRNSRMPDTYSIEVSREQRDLLQQGLRFLRSAALLEPRMPSDETTADRNQRVNEIEQLMETVKTASSKQSKASV